MGSLISFTALPYEHIADACFRIALDNDGINRVRTQRQWERYYIRWMNAEPFQPEVLESVDAWLGTLSDEQIELAACGGENEPDAVAVMQSGPEAADALLNRYFDEVC